MFVIVTSLSKILIIDIFVNQLIEFYSNNAISPLNFTQ